MTIEIYPDGVPFSRPRVPVLAKVRFASGNTSGMHEIGGETLEEVVVQVRAFLAALDAKAGKA